MGHPARKRLTYREYLDLERETDMRHEFLNGEAWAMAGGTVRHSRLKTRLLLQVGTSIGDGRCEPFDSDLKVRVLSTGLATYPDLTVVCDGDERHPEDPEAITNPSLLAEVLSPTTEAWDRGGKALHYRQIATLQHYLLVRVDAPHIEYHRRQEDGSWRLTDHRAGDVLSIPELGVRIDLDALYRGLPEDPPPSEPSTD